MATRNDIKSDSKLDKLDGPHDDEPSQQLRRLEEENRKLKGKVEGFQFLGNMYRDSRQHSRLYQQQNGLLLQILSFLTSARVNGQTLLPELEELPTISDQTPVESLKTLNSINSKLMDHAIANAAKTEQGDSDRKEATTMTETETQVLNPDDQHQRNESETVGKSPASNSVGSTLIVENTPFNPDLQLREDFERECLIKSNESRSICDVCQKVIGGDCTTTPTKQVMGNAERKTKPKETMQEIVLSKEENENLKKEFNPKTHEKKKSRESEEDNQPPTLSKLALEDWHDVGEDLDDFANTTATLRKEKEHMGRVNKKLRSHVDELSKANRAWERQYEAMKKEFTSKVLTLKEKWRKSATTPKEEEFELIGPEEIDDTVVKPKVKQKERMLKNVNESDPRARNEDDPSDDNVLLRHQLKIFKEDFAKERADYNRLIELHKKTLKEVQDKDSKLKYVADKLRKAHTELASLKKEKENAHHPPFMHTIYAPAFQIVSTEMPISSKANGPQKDDFKIWTCHHCTYRNIDQRSTCEMCGKKASRVSNAEGVLMSRSSGNVFTK